MTSAAITVATAPGRVEPHPDALISGGGLEQFQAVLSQLEPLLKRLLVSPKHPRLDHGRGAIPTMPGVYLFSDVAGRPMYVGQSRNLNRRLGEHCRDSSDHNKASFAFNIAKRTAAGAGVDIAGFRAELVARGDFEEQFAVAKRQVATMPVQFVTEDRADLRTVFEVYATYALGTQEYNSFETH